MFVSAGLDCILAGWGVSSESPKVVHPENLKTLRVKIYEKSKCKAKPAIVKSNDYLCAGVPGMRLQASLPFFSSKFHLKFQFRLEMLRPISRALNLQNIQESWISYE